MAEIVNLTRARKRRSRDAAAAAAASNRAAHGRTKAERLRDEREAARQAALLDGARLDETDPAAGEKQARPGSPSAGLSMVQEDH